MKGFTLLEMLVVVLIIGILASVAMPQYQRAVERSRAIEAITVSKSIIASQNRALDAFPNLDVDDRSALDITLVDGTWTNDRTFTTRMFSYVLSNEGVAVTRLEGAHQYTLTFHNNSSSEPDSCSGATLCATFGEMGFQNNNNN